MNSDKVKNLLIEIGLAVNKKSSELLSTGIHGLNKEVKVSPADIIYQIDVEAEEEIIAILSAKGAEFGGIKLIAEGIGENDLSYYPEDCQNPSITIICDPIDGSRGLMYGKRSAFFLAAAGAGNAASMKDMNISVMVELPVPKQGEFDMLWAERGKGVHARRYNREFQSEEITLKPSDANSVEGGFMSFARFCYPGKDLISRIEETFLDRLFKDRKEKYLPVFEDQYISTGGQMYELICGHDLFTADFRASMYKYFASINKKEGQICHPYDMAGLLIAEEAGVLITDVRGKSFDCPLSTDNNVDWIGFANRDIREQCESLLQSILREENILQ